MATETPNSWLGAVLETVISVWQALVVPTAVGFFAFYKFRSGRTDNKDALTDSTKRDARRDGMTYEQQLQAAVIEAAASEKESTRWVVEQLKRLLEQAEAEKDESWADRDRWQRIATHCYRLTLERTGDLRQARALAAAKGRRLIAAGLMREDEMQTWSDLPLVPNIEEIVPKQGK